MQFSHWVIIRGTHELAWCKQFDANSFENFCCSWVDSGWFDLQNSKRCESFEFWSLRNCNWSSGLVTLWTHSVVDTFRILDDWRLWLHCWMIFTSTTIIKLKRNQLHIYNLCTQLHAYCITHYLHLNSVSFIKNQCHISTYL